MSKNSSKAVLLLAVLMLMPLAFATAPTYNLTSVAGDTVSPYKTTDTTPAVVFTTNQISYCQWSRTDVAYASGTNCTVGQNTTSHTCTTTALPQGVNSIHMVCNGSTAANNLDISLTVFGRTGNTLDQLGTGTAGFFGGISIGLASFLAIIGIILAVIFLFKTVISPQFLSK